MTVRQTRKYVLGRAKLREVGQIRLRQPSAENLYGLLARAGFAWDPDAGWYPAAGEATGRVSVRLIGTFRDVVHYASTLGLPGDPRPGDGGTWRLYAEVASGAPVKRVAQMRAGRAAR